MQGILALEDGTVFTGEAFGNPGDTWGEVVFSTGMSGYQEALTDSSNSGLILVMTYPLIGNYGIMKEKSGSNDSFARGIVVSEFCEEPSNWRQRGKIADFLHKENIFGLAGVDTRALARHLRKVGAKRGVLSTDTSDVKALIQKAVNSPTLTGQNLALAAAAKGVTTLPGSGRRVALLDFGSAKPIADCLVKRNCEVKIVPPDIQVADIMSLRPGGVILGNGPGDPTDIPPNILETVRTLAALTPIMGIGLGHLLLGLAFGAKTYKMKTGHRGVNHPVKELITGRVYITSQNHGFDLVEDSLAGLELIITHRNLNDTTIEGIRHAKHPAFSLQYNPEAAPGPKDSEYIFDRFVELMDKEAR